MLTGNKGEWSEIYVLLKLLSEGRLYAADEDLNKLEKIFFPIIKIIREEISNEKKEYFCGDIVEVYLNGRKVNSLPASRFSDEAEHLLSSLNLIKGNPAFSIERTQSFMDEISCYKLTAPASDKSDITIEIVDINTGYRPTVGFSIKSELGAKPTLLNAGRTTNFIYKINYNSLDLAREVNGIYKVSGGRQHTDVRGRIEKIISQGGQLQFSRLNNDVFRDNLILIDSNLDKMLAETILYFYRDGITHCKDMVDKLEQINPMHYGNVNAYRYKFKKFLTAIALGMKPGTVWNGQDEASGGYIVVTKAGDVVAYHIYNRNYFEEYLLNNTKYETASTSRHDFGDVYEVDGEAFINLNLQIRFS